MQFYNEEMLLKISQISPFLYQGEMDIHNCAGLLCSAKKYTYMLKSIQDGVKEEFPLESDGSIVLVDTSIFMVPFLTRKEMLNQFFFFHQ